MRFLFPLHHGSLHSSAPAGGCRPVGRTRNYWRGGKTCENAAAWRTPLNWAIWPWTFVSLASGGGFSSCPDSALEGFLWSGGHHCGGGCCCESLDGLMSSWWGSGLVTYLILFGWLFTIKDRRCKKVRFSNLGFHHLFSTVFWDLCTVLTRLTMFLFLSSSGSNNWGEIGGHHVSSKSLSQGSETKMRELLEGMEENGVSPIMGHWQSHLSKSPSDLKLKRTPLPTPFLGTVLNALSQGVIHFVWSVSFKNLKLEISDWLLKNFNPWESGLSS